MKKGLIAFFILVFPSILFAQDTTKSGGGALELGMRTTVSTFSSTGYAGLGSGGQFRLKLSKRLNTEWFADYITTDLDGLGKRVDAHIGWAVMFYAFNTLNKKINPYLMAGHCFDYSRIQPVNYSMQSSTSQMKDRWSSAVHMGIGSHYMLSPNFNLSLSTLYMIHLGGDLHTHVNTINGTKVLVVEKDKSNLSLEGHLLVTLSLNVKIAQLW